MDGETELKTRSTPSPDFVRSALEQADMNALRVALYHQTKDPSLANMAVVDLPLRGGAFEAKVVAREHYPEIIEKAVAYLTDPNTSEVAPPTWDEALDLMAIFQDRSLTSSEQSFGYGDLGFDRDYRFRAWQQKPDANKLKDFKVTIIGAGISGIAAAIQLNQLGIEYQILEKRDELGGTWKINDYPDARVDVSTFLYQYKFETDYAWKSFYASQEELLEYMHYIAEKYDVKDRIHLENELVSAEWDEATKEWEIQVKSADGTVRMERTNFVISAVGLFGTPKLPDIAGIEDFEGSIFHTTKWDNSFDPAGKRIAVIGTGSTGTQLMPGLAERAEHLTVYQRTPSWITPVAGYKKEVSKELRWLLDTMPGYANWYTYGLFVADLWVENFQDLDQDWINNGGLVNEKNDKLRSALTYIIRKKTEGRDDLYEKLVPSYAPTARRLVIDNGFYDALLRDNVSLHTAGIKQITKNGIEALDGTHQEYDLIVLGAGFHVSRYLWPTEYKGRGGCSLEDLWSDDGARAHLGINLPGFPNLFIIYGPNAQARTGSFHSWIEEIIRYIAGLMTDTIERGAKSIEVSQEEYDDYNRKLDEAMKSTIWEVEGKGGYYVNEFGRSGVLMPWRMFEFFDFLRDDDRSGFVFEA